MRYRALGRTGVTVSELCLGTMMFGDWGNTQEDECIRLLHREDGGIVWGQPGESLGMDTNRVLAEIMGTDERPHDVKARLEALFALIGDGDLAGAREAVAALRADKIAAEPELVKADAVIHRKEVIGR